MKKLINIFIHSATILLLLVMNACHNGETGGFENEAEALESGAAIEVSLTRDQFNDAGMVLGKPGVQLFEEIIQAKGHVMHSPEGLARVSPLINGRVQKIMVNLGDPVKKGQALFLLEGDEIISLQQEYAVANARIDMLEADFKRQEELMNENVGSKKEFLRASSEYWSARAVLSGLESRLKIIGLSPEAVARGKISTTIKVISPISGVVTEMDLLLGETIEKNETSLEVTDTDRLLLQINVFEKDINRISEGMRVRFYVPDTPETIFKGEVRRINPHIHEQRRTITLLADFENNGKGKLYPGSFVESAIILESSERLALPQGACFEEGDAYFVLQLKDESDGEMHFIKTYLETGAVNSEYVEVMDADLENILIEGGFNLVVEE